MPQNAFFLWTHDLLLSQKMMQRHFFFPLHPVSMVIFATATALAFVLLHGARFNFRCYTQCEATPTQKSAQKCAATSYDILHERLQSTFTLANLLRRIAQYPALEWMRMMCFQIRSQWRGRWSREQSATLSLMRTTWNSKGKHLRSEWTSLLACSYGERQFI